MLAVIQRFTNGAGDLANAFDRTGSQAERMQSSGVGQETVFRVQGGGMPNASKTLIRILGGNGCRRMQFQDLARCSNDKS